MKTVTVDGDRDVLVVGDYVSIHMAGGFKSRGAGAFGYGIVLKIREKSVSVQEVSPAHNWATKNKVYAYKKPNTITKLTNNYIKSLNKDYRNNSKYNRIGYDGGKYKLPENLLEAFDKLNNKVKHLVLEKGDEMLYVTKTRKDREDIENTFKAYKLKSKW
jgi:hypothetical protein